MKKFAVVNDGVVINIVVWDGVTSWVPSQGVAIEIINCECGIGYAYIDGEFVEVANGQPE